jgi:hypothetical protein
MPIAQQPVTWSEETRGLCPECLRDVPARLTATDGKIWITQTCSRHGENRALLASDAAEYLRLRQYVPARAGGGCCGGDESCDTGSGPPTCVLLLEITQACNLRCPTCYADAHGHDFMPAAEAKRRLDAFFRIQPRLTPTTRSGSSSAARSCWASAARRYRSVSTMCFIAASGLPRPSSR